MRRMPASSNPPADNPPAPVSRQTFGVFAPSLRGPGISAAADVPPGDSIAAPAVCSTLRRVTLDFNMEASARYCMPKSLRRPALRQGAIELAPGFAFQQVRAAQHDESVD